MTKTLRDRLARIFLLAGAAGAWFLFEDRRSYSLRVRTGGIAPACIEAWSVEVSDPDGTRLRAREVDPRSAAALLPWDLDLSAGRYRLVSRARCDGATFEHERLELEFEADRSVRLDYPERCICPD